MCISLNSAEFKSTVIADFPASPLNDQDRMLSYMNTVSTGTTPPTPGTAAANAMVFPVYGEVTDILDCPDPKTSREWLTYQQGVYKEFWEDMTYPRANTYMGRAAKSIHVAGNYMVGIATDVEDIPSTLSRLKTMTSLPEHVPEASDHILDSMDRFYRAQGLGIPQFVIAAFALESHHVDEKNPVTVGYTQSSTVAGKAVFPALDYHGHGDFESHVSRDHKLLLSTNQLNDIFRSTMLATSYITPAEFSAAPAQFPLSIRDMRPGRGTEPAALAPNNDYILDLDTIHAKLQKAQPALDSLESPKTSGLTAFEQRKARIVARALGNHGLLDHSNQPATTAQEFAQTSFGEALFLGDLNARELENL
jgi:hypothetical protein